MERWTHAQIEELKRELCRRRLLDPIFLRCADALGSLQFDLVDARQSRSNSALDHVSGPQQTNGGLL